MTMELFSISQRGLVIGLLTLTVSFSVGAQWVVQMGTGTQATLSAQAEALKETWPQAELRTIDDQLKLVIPFPDKASALDGWSQLKKLKADAFVRNTPETSSSPVLPAAKISNQDVKTPVSVVHAPSDDFPNADSPPKKSLLHNAIVSTSSKEYAPWVIQLAAGPSSQLMPMAEQVTPQWADARILEINGQAKLVVGEWSSQAEANAALKTIQIKYPKAFLRQLAGSERPIVVVNAPPMPEKVIEPEPIKSVESPVVMKSPEPQLPAPELGAPTAGLYTIADAYRDALQYDATLASGVARFKAEGEQTEQAKSQKRPQLNATVFTGWEQYGLQGGGAQKSQATNKEMLAATQALYAPKSDALIEQSLVKVDYSRLNLDSQRAELAVRVSQAYLSTLLAQEGRKLSQAQVETAQKRLYQVSESLKLGYASKVDTYSAQADVDDAQSKLLADEQGLVIQRQGLQQLVGRTLPETLPVPSVQEVALLDKFLLGRDWLSEAKQRNLNVRMAQLGVDIAQKELAVRKAEGKPQVNLGVQYSQTQGGSSYAMGEDKYVFLQLAMPLYTGGYADSRQREALSLIDASQEELRAKSLSAEKLAQEQVSNLISARQRLAALKKAVTSGQNYLTSAEEGYKLGLRDLVEVQRAKEKLYTNQRDLLKSRVELLSNLFQLYAVTAQLDEAWVSALSSDLWMSGDTP
jgi:outer membrane protein TolC